MQERIIRYEVERQATLLGIIDPDAAARLLDTSKLEYDEEGIPKNAKALLETLLKQKSYLAPPAQTQTSPPPNGTTAPTAGTPVQPAPPAIPAMNPGRTAIAAPNTLPPGQIPSWSDIFKRP